MTNVAITGAGLAGLTAATKIRVREHLFIISELIVLCPGLFLKYHYEN
jgi:thioredoxin reductase